MVPATGPLLEQSWTNTGFVTGPVLIYHWPMEFTVGEQNESNAVLFARAGRNAGPLLVEMVERCIGPMIGHC